MTFLESLKAELQPQQLVTTIIIVGMMTAFSKLSLMIIILCFISAFSAGVFNRYWINRQK